MLSEFDKSFLEINMTDSFKTHWHKLRKDTAEKKGQDKEKIENNVGSGVLDIGR